METPEAMRKGGDSGEGVIPGNGAESLIFQAAAHTGDVKMPPKGNKSGAVISRPTSSRCSRHGSTREPKTRSSRRGKSPGSRCHQASIRSTASR